MVNISKGVSKYDSTRPLRSKLAVLHLFFVVLQQESAMQEIYAIIIKGINIFERANEHLKIGFTVLQYDTEFDKDERKDKKGETYLMRAPSIESVKHYIWLLYKLASEPDSIGHNKIYIPVIIIVLFEG